MGDQSQVQSVDEQGDHSTLPAVTYVWADNHQGCMLNLLKTGAGSDLTLLVGPQRTPIKAHSLILMARSQKFQNRLDSKTEFPKGELPPFKSTVQELRLEDEDPEIFKLFLEELYTGKCRVHIVEALPLLKIATEYGVKDLMDKCSDILQQDLETNNVIPVFSKAMEYFNKELIESSLKFICKNAFDILKKDDFAYLRLECLVEILKQDDLKVTNEMEVFDAAFRWGEAECKRQKLDPNNPKDLRKVLNKALAYIRFPNMRQNEFALQVATKSLLDESELMSLMISFMVSPSERSQLSSGRFMSTPRVYTDIRPSEREEPKYYVSRRVQSAQPLEIHSQILNKSTKYMSKPGCFTESLLFTLSQRAKFSGIKIVKKMFCCLELTYPGQFSYQFDQINFTIKLSKVSEELELIQALNDHSEFQSEHKFNYELCLDNSLRLEANQLYKIDLSFSGSLQYKYNGHSEYNYTLTQADIQNNGWGLQLGTGYKSSGIFTARNSAGELETIKVKFSREAGDTKMAITEGFIEKLIFQLE